MITYIDMDGVIADFATWMKQYIPDIEEKHWRDEKHRGTKNDPWAIMDANVDEIYKDFGTLDLLPFFQEMYGQMSDVKFLTAIPKRWYGTDDWETAKWNKLTWLENHFEAFNYDDAIFAKGSGDKWNYAKPGDILFDDLEGNIKKWRRAGGIGIHVKGS